MFLDRRLIRRWWGASEERDPTATSLACHEEMLVDRARMERASSVLQRTTVLRRRYWILPPVHVFTESFPALCETAHDVRVVD